MSRPSRMDRRRRLPRLPVTFRPILETFEDRASPSSLWALLSAALPAAAEAAAIAPLGGFASDLENTPPCLVDNSSLNLSRSVDPFVCDALFVPTPPDDAAQVVPMRPDEADAEGNA